MAFFRAALFRQIFGRLAGRTRIVSRPTDAIRLERLTIDPNVTRLSAALQSNDISNLIGLRGAIRQLGRDHPLTHLVLQRMAQFGRREVNASRGLDIQIPAGGRAFYRQGRQQERFSELSDTFRELSPRRERAAYNAWRFEWLNGASVLEAAEKRVTPVRTGRLQRSVEGSFDVFPPREGSGKIITTAIATPGGRPAHSFSVHSIVEYALYAVRDRWDANYSNITSATFLDAWNAYFTTMARGF